MKHGQTALLTSTCGSTPTTSTTATAPRLRRHVPRPPHQLEAARGRARLSRSRRPFARRRATVDALAAGVSRSSLRRTLARRSHVSTLMTHQPGSISNQRCDELRRRRRGVVVVVQALAGGDERQPLQVAGRVVVRPAAEVVADGVHRRRSAEVDVDVDERGEQADLPARTASTRIADAEAQPEEGVVVEQPVAQSSAAGPWRSGPPSRGCVASRAVQRDVLQLHLAPSRAAPGSAGRPRRR